MTARHALLAVLVLATVVGATAASAPPVEVCTVCGDRFEAAADRHGVDLAVAESTLDVHVREDGSARWVVRNRLDADGAQALRDNRSALDAVVRDALADRRYPAAGGHATLVENPMNVTASLDGDTVVVSFTVEEFAHRSVGGLLVADGFHVERDGRYLSADADRVTVHAPDGYAVSNRPPNADVRGDAAVWADEYGSHAPVAASTYVVFVRDSGPATGVLTQAAIARDIGPVIVRDAARAAVVPTLLVAVLVAGLLAAGDTGLSARTTRVLTGVSLALVVAAVYVAVQENLVRDPAIGGAVPAFALVAGPLAAAAAVAPERVTLRRAAAALVATAAVAWAAVVLAGVGRGWAVPFAAWHGVAAAAFGALPACFLPLGYAAVRERRERWWLAAVVVALPFVAFLPMAPFPRGGVPAEFILTLATALALVPATLLFLVGGGVARPGYRSP